ncbi:hypothetical protein STEG23_021081 [Scotinomys teguina]
MEELLHQKLSVFIIQFEREQWNAQDKAWHIMRAQYLMTPTAVAKNGPFVFMLRAQDKPENPSPQEPYLFSHPCEIPFTLEGDTVSHPEDEDADSLGWPSFCGLRLLSIVTWYVYILLSSMSTSYCPVCLHPIVQYVYILLSSMSTSYCPVCLRPIVQYVYILLSSMSTSYGPETQGLTHKETSQSADLDLKKSPYLLSPSSRIAVSVPD